MMAKLSNSSIFKKKMPVSHQIDEQGVTSFIHSFIHSVRKQKAVVMTGLLITDSLSRSKL